MAQSINQEFRTLSLLKFALPSMVMMIFMSLYTIIDGIFVSRLVGSNALSAVNITYPFYTLLFAIGVMLATGGSAIIAKNLGENKAQEAREHFTLFVVTAIIFSILISVIGIIFISPIVTLLGATEILKADAITYLKTLLFFAPACILQLLFQSYFVTASKPHLGLILTICAGFTNAILDYLFMGPLEMGIKGAALATSIGQLIPAIFGLIYFTFINKELYFTRPRFDFSSLVQACANGSSEMVSNFSNAIVTFLFNLIMMKLLGEDGVAAITIVLYGQFLFGALFLGFSMGVSPVISYNYGSQNTEQLKKVFRICMGFVTIFGIIITVTALLTSSHIVGIFVPKTSNTYNIAAYGFSLFALNYLFVGINIFASSLFTSLSNGKISAIISFTRTFVWIIICLMILPKILGVTGVWLAIPIAELITLFSSIYYIRQQKHTYHYM